ncbi:hypothetical protein LAG90_04630 [Marinilongibacter aquaticus]|uniref:heavy metal-binding domain-containing protein n=1 Tax=Marinilongibacter aquaticus TaxID=2975157 RepID=UPI0021BCFE11|nr:heavy metal-binding domain-containing protein [Marinilongibacter aquaticus]UBM59933.1 hypothetical protein LAG90_04630 [Marinilongibacter aquaticus]
MKYLSVLCMCVALLASCNSASETQGEDSQELVSEKVAYACPMACEGDKVYDEPGKCPVCEMDLEKVMAHGEMMEHHNHEH